MRVPWGIGHSVAHPMPVDAAQRQEERSVRDRETIRAIYDEVAPVYAAALPDPVSYTHLTLPTKA